MPSHDELACTYSALILADDDVPVTAEKITTILKAANVDYEAIWPTLFARALTGVDIKDLITKVGSAAAAPAPAATGAAAASAPAADAKASKKEEKKEESEEEGDDDMGFGLFD
jgi:large subunit ribosomal protein LP1